MAYIAKNKFVLERGGQGVLARPLSVSIYPQHLELLAKREQEFNVSRSTLIGLLLDLEMRQGLLRQELVRRLRTPNWTPQVESIA
jgi:hypothetical protein